MPATSISQLTKNLAACSRNMRLVSACLMTVPALIAMAWLAFPFLESWNLGYPVWHFACLLGFVLAGFAIVCWIAEKSSIGASSPWVVLLILVGLGVGAIDLRLFGDFYWAFTRGYFLN